jgi:hypothetical protein
MNLLDRQWFEEESTKLDYQQGRLTAEQQLAYEEYILDKPELIDELELNLAMTQHANAYQGEQTLISPFAKWIMPFCVGAASSAVILFSVFKLSFTSEPQGVHAIDQIVYLETLRSSNVKNTVIRQAANSRFIVAVTISQPSTGLLTGIIKQRVHEDYKAILQIKDVKVSSSSDAFLHLDTKALDSGSYQIELKNGKGETLAIQGFELVID